MTPTNPTPTPRTPAPEPPSASSNGSAPTPEKVSSGYSLPAELHAQLRAAAKERGFTTSYLVEKALRDYLPRLIPVAELDLVRPAVVQ